MRRPLFSLLVLATGLLYPGDAAGKPDPEIARAKALFQKAEVHFSLGEFDRALALYKEAYKTTALPGFLFNIGQCHRNLGQHEKAIFFYRQYLSRSGDPPNKEEVSRLIEICELAVKASAPASRPASQATPLTPPSTTRVALPATLPAPPEPPPPPPSRRRLRPGWFWSGVAVSVALLGTGVATGVLALQQSSEYKDRTTPVDRRQELRDSGQRLATTASVTVGVGAAAAVGTIVLSLFTDFGGRSAEHRALAVAPVPGGAAALVGGAF